MQTLVLILMWTALISIPVILSLSLATLIYVVRKEQKRSRFVNVFIKKTSKDSQDFNILLSEQFEIAAEHRATLYKELSAEQGRLSESVTDGTEQMRAAFVNTNLLISANKK